MKIHDLSLVKYAKAYLRKHGIVIRRLPRKPEFKSNQPSGSKGFDWRLLHLQNPYEGFALDKWDYDPRGWNAETSVFELLITRLKPKLIIEVGSWKGASAVTMGTLLANKNILGTIVCVDTWLGALEFWTNQDDTDRYLALQCRNGYPQVYYQFLANMMHSGLQDRVVPFPATSITAAAWFQQMGIKADLIYIDASHEAPDVYADLCNYWPSVRDGGVLFGDDYNWAGVKQSVDRFTLEKGLKLQIEAEKWILEA